MSWASKKKSQIAAATSGRMLHHNDKSVHFLQLQVQCSFCEFIYFWKWNKLHIGTDKNEWTKLVWIVIRPLVSTKLNMGEVFYTVKIEKMSAKICGCMFMFSPLWCLGPFLPWVGSDIFHKITGPPFLPTPEADLCPLKWAFRSGGSYYPSLQQIISLQVISQEIQLHASFRSVSNHLYYSHISRLNLPLCNVKPTVDIAN